MSKEIKAFEDLNQYLDYYQEELSELNADILFELYDAVLNKDDNQKYINVLKELLLNNHLKLTPELRVQVIIFLDQCKFRKILLPLELIIFIVNSIESSKRASLLDRYFLLLSPEKHTEYIDEVVKITSPIESLRFVLNSTRFMSKELFKSTLDKIKINFLELTDAQKIVAHRIIVSSLNSIHQHSLFPIFNTWIHDKGFLWFPVHPEVDGLPNTVSKIELRNDSSFPFYVYLKQENLNFELCKDLIELNKNYYQGILLKNIKYCFFSVDPEELKNYKEDVELFDDVVNRIVRGYIVFGEGDRFIEALIQVFNNKHIKFNKNKIYTYIVSHSSDPEIVSRLLSEVDTADFNFLSHDVNEMQCYVIDNYFYSDKSREYQKVVSLFIEKFKSYNISFIDILNESVVRGLNNNKRNFLSKMKVVEKYWTKVYGKKPLFPVDSFDHKKYIPLSKGTIIDRLEKIESKEEFVTLFTDKRKLTKSMEQFLETLDTYKLWVVDGLIGVNFNYDLIVDFMNSEIEYPESDLIHRSLSPFILELMKVYPERRIIECLKKKMNLSFFDDLYQMIERINEENPDLLKEAMPTKPKNLDEIMIAIKVMYAQLKEENSLFCQDSISHLEGVEIDGLKIVVPKSHYELVYAGARLSQCVGDGHYTSQILKGNSFIFLMYEKEELKYCVELNHKGRSIRSASGYKNSQLNSELRKKIGKIIKGQKVE